MGVITAWLNKSIRQNSAAAANDTNDDDNDDDDDAVRDDIGDEDNMMKII